jgi:hypothetical protein
MKAEKTSRRAALAARLVEFFDFLCGQQWPHISHEARIREHRATRPPRAKEYAIRVNPF